MSIYEGYTYDEQRLYWHWAARVLEAEIGTEAFAYWEDQHVTADKSYGQLAEEARESLDAVRGISAPGHHWSDRPEIDERPH